MEKMRRKIIVTIKESWTKENSAWKKDDLKIEWWNVKCTQQSPSAFEWNMDALVRRMHCKDANEETLPEHMWMNVCTRRDRKACYVRICDQIQINHWTKETESEWDETEFKCRYKHADTDHNKNQPNYSNQKHVWPINRIPFSLFIYTASRRQKKKLVAFKTSFKTNKKVIQRRTFKKTRGEERVRRLN